MDHRLGWLNPCWHRKNPRTQKVREKEKNNNNRAQQIPMDAVNYTDWNDDVSSGSKDPSIISDTNKLHFSRTDLLQSNLI